MKHSLTAVLIREGSGFVALCPEVDVASQGDSPDEARGNLQEAVELFFECASEEEVRQRLSSESCGPYWHSAIHHAPESFADFRI